MDTRFLAFTLVCAVLIVTPGPDTALITRTALARSWAAANLATLGVAAGSAVWASLSIVGVAALLAASPVAFTVLKVMGSCYLVFLGLSILLGHPAGGGQETKHAAVFAQGLLNNLLNPKAGAIFLTVWPQFVKPGDPAARLALMLATFELMLLLWLGIYGCAISRARQANLRPAFTQAAHTLTGLMLVGLGARLVLEPQ